MPTPANVAEQAEFSIPRDEKYVDSVLAGNPTNEAGFHRVRFPSGLNADDEMGVFNNRFAHLFTDLDGDTDRRVAIHQATDYANGLEKGVDGKGFIGTAFLGDIPELLGGPLLETDVVVVGEEYPDEDRFITDKVTIVD